MQLGQRDAAGRDPTGTSPDADGQSRFRSLMSELGVAIAPRLMTPADTLGYAGLPVLGRARASPRSTRTDRYGDARTGTASPASSPTEPGGGAPAIRT